MEGSTTLVDYGLWSTATIKLGWAASGVFPVGADGTDINSVDANADRTLIAASDDFGTMCVYRFPCLNRPLDSKVLSEKACSQSSERTQ